MRINPAKRRKETQLTKITLMSRELL
jgi:hypothetical protein